VREVQDGTLAAYLKAWSIGWVSVTAIELFVVDRTLKWYARTYEPVRAGVLAVHYHLNNYGPFSAPVPKVALLIFGLAAAAGLVYLTLASARNNDTVRTVGFALMVVGGASNLMDRLTYGGVVDLFYVIGGLTFNLADVYLVAGAILALHISAKRYRP
jgi:lipoprotein signal peptidase